MFMTKKFDNFIKENMGVADVVGADGPYPTDDARTPKILGPMIKRKKFKKKRHK
jgi:hypothetical protein